MRDFLDITLAYYSEWLGCDIAASKGVTFVKTPLRDRIQRGYSEPFYLYAWLDGKRLIVSYGDASADIAERLKDAIKYPINAESFAEALADASGKAPERGIKFLFEGSSPKQSAARALSDADYDAYARFFAECHPGTSAEGWLREYFEEMCAVGACAGVFEGGRLLSCTDLPGMPFMEDAVREIGVNTVPDARRKGHARAASEKAAGLLLAKDLCPLWSTSAGNKASRNLARSAGFKELAETFSL